MLEIEEYMLTAIKEQMVEVEIPVPADEEWITLFYPVFEEKWNELVDESAVESDGIMQSAVVEMLWQPVFDELSDRVWELADNYDITDSEESDAGYVWGQALGYC